MPSIDISHIAQDALQIALAQPFIPLSPASSQDDGQVLLCAAACFAAAGLERAFGPAERRKFEAALGEGDKRLVYDAYRRLGWSAASCTAAMQPNDAASVSDRPETMRRLVRRAMSDAPLQA